MILMFVGGAKQKNFHFVKSRKSLLSYKLSGTLYCIEFSIRVDFVRVS